MARGVNADFTRLRTRWWGSGSCQIITLRMTSVNEPSPWLNASSTTCGSLTTRGVPEDHVGLGEARERPRAVEDLGPVLVHRSDAAQLVVQRVQLARASPDRRAAMISSRSVGNPAGSSRPARRWQGFLGL